MRSEPAQRNGTKTMNDENCTLSTYFPVHFEYQLFTTSFSPLCHRQTHPCRGVVLQHQISAGRK